MPKQDSIEEPTKKSPRKRRAPRLVDYSKEYWPGVGFFEIARQGDDHLMTWQKHQGQRKSVLLSELCRSTDRLQDRAELGLLAADIHRTIADREMEAITSFSDAVKHTEARYRQETEWRRWVAAPASQALLESARGE